MVSLGNCTSSGKHHPFVRSLLPPRRRCFFPEQQQQQQRQHNRWKQRRSSRHGRGGSIIVGGVGGDESAPASDSDLHAAAARAASIRFEESHRPDPLFVDLYAGCLLPTGVTVEDGTREQHPPPSMASLSPCHYTLATKFIDDKLLSVVGGADEVKQIVLLTDGFDTRPYRLKWPLRSLVVFDVSPESVFKVALHRLESVGAEIMKTCKYVHIPLESCDLQAALCNKGFDGGRPSLWAFQGLPVVTFANFREILFVVSNLAMKGCIFVGEMPGWLVDTEIGSKITVQKWMTEVFMSNGFRMETINYNDVAKNVDRISPPGDYNNILFVAEQLQFSDKQMENWRKEFLRMEEEGDEEGFEDLL